MRLAGLVLILVGFLDARTLPLYRFEVNIIPLAITQDREGLLWLAASPGVWRFDGLHFEPVQAPPGIDLSTAKDIAAAPDGSIWIGTGSGLIRHSNGRFSMELPGQIHALLVTRTGRLLAAVGPASFVNICLQPNDTPCRWSQAIKTTVMGEFQEDLDGNVWFGTSASICFWSDADVKAAARGTKLSTLHRIRFATAAGTPKGPINLEGVVMTPGGTVWARNGPDVVRIENGKLTRPTALPVETFEGVRPGFLLDRRGRLWIPSRQPTVIENGRIQALDPSLPLQDVTVVFQDRANTLWFGLAGKGLAAVPDEAGLKSWWEAEGISASVVDLAVHPRLGLIAATDSGAFMLSERALRWQPVPSIGTREALRSVSVRADGALLSLPYRGGLSLSEPPFRATRELPLPSGVDPKRLKKIYRDPQGGLWICAIAGLFRLDAAGQVRKVPLPGEPSNVSDLWMDAEGRLWVGYEGGVARCLGEKCESVIAPKDGLIDPRIRTIAPGAGEVWVGYRQGEGFSRFGLRGGAWVATHFKPQDGYGSKDTHFLRRDRRGWIWRGATDGVYVSDGKHTEPEDWIHLTFGDRVNASYAHMYGFLEAADGSIWIGTQAGVVRLHPSADWFAPAQTRVQRIGGAGRGREDVEIHLSRPGLPPFQSRLFRYRLLPVDSKWRFSSDGRLRYAGLRRGAYRLQLASGNGNAPLEQTFRVGADSGSRAPIWFSLAAAAGMALIWVIARRRRFAGKSREAEDYWRQKQLFLEERGRSDAADVSPDDWSGRLLEDRFLLETRVAFGGFASVYRAADNANGGEAVAVKLLHPLRDHEQWRRRRFADEVSALQNIDHPGIVRIRYAGEAAPDRPYLVMEFVEGMTLRALLAAGPVEYERAARLLEQIGAALAAAHRARILHRDVKPENVMVCEAGLPAERIKLLDFGIASIRAEQKSGNSTQLAGSPGYLAPERWIGLETCASDVYSMAAIAWEMLTGESYHHGMESSGAGLPQTVLDLLARGLAYDPADRPQDAEAFAAELSAQLVACRRESALPAPEHAISAVILRSIEPRPGEDH